MVGWKWTHSDPVLHQEAQQAPDLYDRMAALLARMQPIGEDMVRGIAVRHVLHGFGAALRLHPSNQQETRSRLHQKSRPIETWPFAIFFGRFCDQNSYPEIHKPPQLNEHSQRTLVGFANDPIFHHANPASGSCRLPGCRCGVLVPFVAWGSLAEDRDLELVEERNSCSNHRNTGGTWKCPQFLRGPATLWILGW